MLIWRFWQAQAVPLACLAWRKVGSVIGHSNSRNCRAGFQARSAAAKEAPQIAGQPRRAAGWLGVRGTGMTVGPPGGWTPAAWVLLLAFLVSPTVCTFSGPFPGPDKWADVPPATRRVSSQSSLPFAAKTSSLQQHTRYTKTGPQRRAVQTLDGREVVYTLPARPARGVLVFLHGHMQRAYEWGFPSATCPNCTGGLPCGIAPVVSKTCTIFVWPGLGLAQADGRL